MAFPQARFSQRFASESLDQHPTESTDNIVLRKGFQPLTIFALIGILTHLLGTAFVPKINQEGQVTRWDFHNPPSLVPNTIFNRSTRAIRFSLSEDAFSEAHREAELNAVRAALGQWESIPGTFLRFEEGPLVSDSLDVNPSDDNNIIKWAKSSTLVNGEKTDIRGRLGIALTLFFGDGRMAAADVILNGVEHSWFANPLEPIEGARFIEGTVSHEWGHVLGLEHSPMGAATMFARDSAGLGFQNGLTQDEVSFAQATYGEPATLSNLARLEGRVSLEGDPIAGAAIFLETRSGRIVGGTVSIDSTERNALGFYRFDAIPPGDYQVRVEPFAPNTSNSGLVKGRDISFFRFDQAPTEFRPSEPSLITLTRDVTTTLDFDLDDTPPAFRIETLRQFTDRPRSIRSGGSTVVVTAGDQDLTVGVFGSKLPTENVELLITGDGLTMGPTESTTQFFSGLPHLFRQVTVANDATPGIRSYIVRQGNNVAYASGFLEVQPKIPDNNFDGLSDLFQRQHFAPFTDPNAAPSADPDQDGLSNEEEARQGTDPTVPSPGALPPTPLRILQVALTTDGASVSFPSAPGTTYRLYARDELTKDPWSPVGESITGDGSIRTLVDPTANNDIRFYEVRIDD